ncbi:MAG: 23S rRNA (adenine(2503)-C(2))-methyltransferase RlmN [Deltaproteobacteria bacterium]|nr:23S rRNA (adenine(2503)-C(2))-methyltransferase RlmN [Deltaproteobacteria bacterium]
MLRDKNKTDIKELSTEKLASWLEDNEIEPYRSAQILKWIYLKQVDSFDMMTDLSKEVRKLLSLTFSIKRLEKVTVKKSQDGSKKYLFRLKDGNHIESVLIPEKDHYTLCISSQVGCAQGCSFCLTAKDGFTRNLTKDEIVSQVRDVKKDHADPKPVTNIVFMGMGEPLANYKNVVDAVNTILETAGLVQKLSSLGRETTVNLAVSLNATENETRSILMPINKKYPIEKLLDACRRYHLKPRRRITFEYILLKGINDSTNDANRLVKLLRSIRAKINLIPFNEYEGSIFRRPEESVVNRFLEILHKNGYTAIIRHSKGQDICAACGQLRAKVGSS